MGKALADSLPWTTDERGAMTAKKCRACNGLGTVIEGQETDDGRIAENGLMTCPDCNGTGRSDSGR